MTKSELAVGAEAVHVVAKRHFIFGASLDTHLTEDQAREVAAEVIKTVDAHRKAVIAKAKS